MIPVLFYCWYGVRKASARTFRFWEKNILENKIKSLFAKIPYGKCLKWVCINFSTI